MIVNLLIAVHGVSCILKSLSVDENQLARYMNSFTNFRCSPIRVDMAPSRLKLMCSVLFALTSSLMFPAACVKLCSRD